MNIQKTSMKKSAWLLFTAFLCTTALFGSLPKGQAQAQQNETQAEVQSTIPVQADIVYGEVDGHKLLVDVYGADAVITPATVKRPAIIFVHGGAWSAGSKRDFRHAATQFAKQGYVGFCVGYRLLKGQANRHPAQIDDVQRAVRWMRANADKYGIDPEKIGAFGGSAGGHLVSLLGTTDTRDNSDKTLAAYSSRVQCVVNLFGPTDFTLALDDNARAASENKIAARIIENFLGTLPEARANYIDASPAARVDKKTVPFIIFHGGKDWLVPPDQSQRLDAALKKAGIESKLVIYPDQGHGFVDPALSQTFAASLEFFNRHLKKQVAPASPVAPAQ